MTAKGGPAGGPTGGPTGGRARPPRRRPAAPPAFATEEKQVRREAILTAARALFLADGGGSLPSAARIAEAAGLAKGTVYLYFRTKEEIFAALLTAEWGALLGEARAAFEAPDGTAADAVAAFRARYTRHLARRPDVLRLDALGYGVLEQNLGPEALRAFKRDFFAQLAGAGGAVDQRLGLPAGRGVQLLMRSYALTRGLWQTLEHPEPMAALMAEPGLAPMRPDFHAELEQALAEYWRGALGGGI